MDVPGNHIRYEAVRERTFSVEGADHLFFLNGEHSRWCERGRRLPTTRQTRPAPSPKKVTRSKHRHDCFFTVRIDNSQFHAALLNVHHMRSWVTLRVGCLLFSILEIGRAH